MPWLAEFDAVSRNPEVLTLGKNVFLPVFGGRRPLPDMGRHSVENLHRVGACRCHCFRVAVVEGLTYCRTAAIGSTE